MSGISVCNMDTAGGIIKPGPNQRVFYQGSQLAVVGCEVVSHGPGTHQGAVMVTGSAKVFIDKIPVCMAGSLASCGDRATGRPNLTTNV